MVMKRNAMAKNLKQSILKSFGRYIAILAIIALGSSIFVGLRMTKADMVATGQKYMRDQNMFDLRLISTYGWSQEQVDTVLGWDEVLDAEGQNYLDLIFHMGDESEEVFRVYTIPERINLPVLVSGRMPESADECLADGFLYDESMIGTRVYVSASNDEDSLDVIMVDSFTVVGIISTPLYMDMNRGTTTVGNGSITNYFYVPAESFDVEYFTEIQVRIPGQYEVYSQEYNNTLDSLADTLDPKVLELAQDRFAEIKDEAEEKYAEGLSEYEDGAQELDEAKLEVEKELADALLELQDGELKIQEGIDVLILSSWELEEAEEQIAEGWAAVEQGWAELEQQRKTAEESFLAAEQQLHSQKQSLLDNLDSVNSGLEQIEAGIQQFNASLMAQAGITGDQLPGKIQELKTMVAGLELQRDEALAQGDAATAQMLQGYIDMLNGTIASLESAYATYSGLIGQRTQLQSTKSQIESGLAQVEQGFAILEQQKQDVLQQIESGVKKLEDTQAFLRESEEELSAGWAQIGAGWQEIREAKEELADGWLEYEEGKLEAEEELRDAEEELAEGWEELMEAREEIDSMEPIDYFLLDRTSNLGYSSLDSSSSIVAGVSRIIPVFFLLVASLVCITTMTRMVDEERTQIGTLKALGYSSASIVSKYLIYAGSGAVIGCGLGTILGSIIFPSILWEIYKILLHIPIPVVLTIDWALCLVVVGVYTLVILIVTWYCCYRTLLEVPAELIRPKPPTSGKRLIFERIPLWNNLSFLNKVTIRNIFRYRQRLAMMIVGVGGCTALLLTGFGLRDSLSNIVNFQFDEITVYDMSVYFTEGQTKKQQDDFRLEMEGFADSLMYYHQTSVEVEFENHNREIYMIAAEPGVVEFINFHRGDEQLDIPGVNQLLLTSGVADAMGIHVGDVVCIRDADMRTMELTVSGIYDNYVYNYAVVLPETVEQCWGEKPEEQMAFIKVVPGQDVHEVAAHAAEQNNVLNVSVSIDIAEMVGGMMEALDLVVVIVVICAGMLASIVLYNLTNININERIREIATIKVLGFNAAETSMYIFKENLALSVLGSIVGLFMGKFLLDFVMSQIKIDLVWFQSRIMPVSYIWSVGLTILMAILVDFVFFFKLEKVNMAEALKSVE